MPPAPDWSEKASGPIAVWTDPGLASVGVTLAFSERTGGVSEEPFDSLNLAGHVGDVAVTVDENRTRLLDALGLSAYRGRLTTAEQVHGDEVALVSRSNTGAGAWVSGRDADRGPLPGADALITSEPGVPLLLCFADCVPIVLVAPGPAVGGRPRGVARLPCVSAGEGRRGARRARGLRPELHRRVCWPPHRRLSLRRRCRLDVAIR